MQAIPDSARVLREANRLQEQQRFLQSRQQHQQQGLSQQQSQAHFVAQGAHTSNMNMAANGTHNNPAMMAAFHPGMQSPRSFPNGTAQNVSTPSPRMGQPNPLSLSSGLVPTINNIESQIQRSNPHMTPEQVSKVATERLQQYQQRVSMNAAVQGGYQLPHDANFQAHAQHGMHSNAPGIQLQGFSPVMRAQQGRVSVGNSPPMNGAVMAQPSRSATPQMQRTSSGGAGAGAASSPRPPQTQMASG